MSRDPGSRNLAQVRDSANNIIETLLSITGDAISGLPPNVVLAIRFGEFIRLLDSLDIPDTDQMIRDYSREFGHLYAAGSVSKGGESYPVTQDHRSSIQVNEVRIRDFYELYSSSFRNG